MIGHAGWIWLYFGVFLMLLELLMPGFVVFFFGLAALSVGALIFLLGDSFGGTAQFVTFAILAILYILTLRRFFARLFKGSKDSKAEADELVGRVGTVTAAIRPPVEGRVQIGDAEWAAIAQEAIEVGQVVQVKSRQNLTIQVEVTK